MDKKAIKNFATWARTELIDRVKLRAEKFGVVDDRPAPSLDSYKGYVFTNVEKEQRLTLVKKIVRDGYEQTVEEVAYTWFNRFCALRFMEVNGYLPSRVRVFTNEANEFKPQIIEEVQIVDLEGLDLGTVYAFQDKNDDEGLFKYLIITQCNALNSVLPGMFQKINDYTELLFPDNLRREESVVGRMIEMIPETDFDVATGSGQVEIIGWLYQYYIYEKHNEVVDPLHGKIISKEDIPAATQLFTTDWIVRYIVDNTVGRYWIERNPNSRLLDSLEFFVTPKDGRISDVDEKIKPQDLTVFDPCVGSGHMLVYAFDVLLNVYREAGYSDSEAAFEIINNNLYGLDIDERAAQLAYFAVMMKGRQYDKRFLKRGVQPNVFAIKETEEIDDSIFETFIKRQPDFSRDVAKLRYSLENAKETGSLIRISNVDLRRILDSSEITEAEFVDLKLMCQAAELLCNRYCAVVTNPPYLNKYDAALKQFVLDNYKAFSSDLFAAVVYRCFDLCKENGYSGFMSPFVWMFIKSYESLRQYILTEKQIVSLIQMEYSAFEEATVPVCSYVLRNGRSSSKGLFFRLSAFKGGMEVQERKFLEAKGNKDCGYFYETSQENFSEIPGAPIAYWVSENFFNVYEHKSIGDYANVITGMTIGDNQKYLRLWQEVDYKRISFEKNMESIDLTKMYWIPYSKGGSRRNWYGNYDYIVNWSKKDYFNRSKTTLQHLYLKRALTWPFVTSGTFSARILPEGFLWDVAGSPCFFNDLYIERYTLGFLCSNVADYILNIVNPTINVQAIDLARIPLIIEESCIDIIFKTVNTNIEKSKSDWDSFETSWNFQSHPLVNQASKRLVEVYSAWESESSKRFVQLKSNEESLNKIFIDIYGLQNELTPEVDDKDVTVRKADKEREVKSLISYAVGCMFGRYSLDKPGLIYAGGEWDSSQYKTFAADSNNVIPITEESRFKDDAASRFFEFIRTVYGAETLEENLKFIADALGGSGSPRDVIRNYFLNGFYADHVKIYQKRPIYWLFDSGKKNGFKCLIYMHRYAPDLLARIRTDYIHRLQQIYHSEISELDAQIEAASNPKTLRDLNKKRKTLLEQAEEVRKYEEKIHHLADQKIAIDLDDGVKVNYAKFSDVLATIK